MDLSLSELFQEYIDKNLALILIEDSGIDKEKIYIKTKILNKNIDKNLIITKSNLNKESFIKKLSIKLVRN